MRVVAIVAIVCACLLLVGGSDQRERLRVTVLSEPTLLTVVITFKTVTDAYRWLSVQGCSAQITEHGSFCTGDYETESSVELSGRKQELFHWRHVPRGTLLVTAMAFDVDRKPLAMGQAVVFR